jgi:hypothetical protein
MSAQCNHAGKVKFLHTTCADRWPGVWFCEGCEQRFSFDPEGKTSVRYLKHPNPAILWKTIEIAPERDQRKMNSE